MATGFRVDYKPQTDIRAIKSGTAKAVAEVAKYPVKTAPILSLPDDEAVEVLKTLTLSLNKNVLLAMVVFLKQLSKS